MFPSYPLHIPVNLCFTFPPYSRYTCFILPFDFHHTCFILQSYLLHTSFIFPLCSLHIAFMLPSYYLKGTWIWLLVSRPTDAWKKQMRICFFFESATCFSGPVFFWTDERTISWAEPGWAACLEQKKKPSGRAQKAFSRSGCLAAPLFFFRAFVFFWPDGRKLRGEMVFGFSCVSGLFSGPVFFSDGRTHDFLAGARTGN